MKEFQLASQKQLNHFLPQKEAQTMINLREWMDGTRCGEGGLSLISIQKHDAPPFSF